MPATERANLPCVPDLFSFAYVPNWYIQLDELAALALPEPWRFRNPAYLTKNPDNPILERYQFFGHYHTNRVIREKYVLLYEQIIRLKL